MSDKMREEFEAWRSSLTVGDTIEWEIPGWSEEDCAMFAAWQASRSALVIELPRRIYSQGTSDEYKRGAKAFMSACEHRLIAAGLKVKP